MMEEVTPNAMEKLIMVLTHFADNSGPIGTCDLSQRLQLNKSTVSRILRTLTDSGYLDKDTATQKYCLGPMISRLNQAITQSIEGQTSLIAQPYCDELRDTLGATIHFEVLSGSHIYMAYVARNQHPISVSTSTGDRVYPHIHAGAKCIAAFTNPRIVENWLQGNLPQYNLRAPLNSEALFREYKEIVSTGYSIDNGNHHQNIYAIGAPVFDCNCRAVASVVALALNADKAELEKDEAINKILETTKKITERLKCPQKYEDIGQHYQQIYAEL
jgi:DNA-binding IclR family transcriptional regulator